jgi:hypothetical protein
MSTNVHKCNTEISVVVNVAVSMLTATSLQRAHAITYVYLILTAHFANDHRTKQVRLPPIYR